jgi:hypothetical protein
MPKKLLRAALFMGGTMPVAEGSGQGIRACGMPQQARETARM